MFYFSCSGCFDAMNSELDGKAVLAESKVADKRKRKVIIHSIYIFCMLIIHSIYVLSIFMMYILHIKILQHVHILCVDFQNISNYTLFKR